MTNKSWEQLDQKSGVLFTVELTEANKYKINPTYNKIKINIRDYELDYSGIETLFEVLNNVLMDKLKTGKKKKNGKT